MEEPSKYNPTKVNLLTSSLVSHLVHKPGYTTLNLYKIIIKIDTQGSCPSHPLLLEKVAKRGKKTYS